MKWTPLGGVAAQQLHPLNLISVAPLTAFDPHLTFTHRHLRGSKFRNLHAEREFRSCRLCCYLRFAHCGPSDIHPTPPRSNHTGDAAVRQRAVLLGFSGNRSRFWRGAAFRIGRTALHQTIVSGQRQ
jgi:hypothetical protein